MATCTSRVACTSLHMNDKPLSAPYMTPPLQDMQDDSAPKLSWNETFGGLDFPPSSMPSSLDVRYANKIKLTITRLAPH